MRTTLDIDVDILAAAKEIAAQEKSTAGRVLSQLARKGLTSSPALALERSKLSIRNGVPVFQPSGHVLTNQAISELMDEEGI